MWKLCVAGKKKPSCKNLLFFWETIARNFQKNLEGSKPCSAYEEKNKMIFFSFVQFV